MARNRRRRTTTVPMFAAVVIGTAFLLAACGSSAKTSPTSSSGGASRTTQSTDGNSTSPTTTSTANGPIRTTATTYSEGRVYPKPSTPTTLPREDPGQPIGPNLSAGQQVIIYSKAIWPEYLYPTYTSAVTWTNLSGRTQTITFYHVSFSSPPIPPGGQWVWKAPSAGVLGYHDSSGAVGELNLQAATPIVTP